jgi:hypothetical protein
MAFSTVSSSSDEIGFASGRLTSMDTKASVSGRLAASMTLDAALASERLWTSSSILSINTFSEFSLSPPSPPTLWNPEEETEDKELLEEELAEAATGDGSNVALIRGCSARGTGSVFSLAASLQRLASK